MSNEIKISIIIPVYKVENYLCQCVDSVLLQSFSNIEVILINDGSPDSCPEICDSYAIKDSRVRVVHQRNMGLGGARNAGLHLARGDYVLFLDSDDYLERDACAKLYARAREYDADIVFCQAKYFDEESQSCILAHDASSLPLFQAKHLPPVFHWQDIGAAKIFSYDSFVVAWNKMCKRSFLAQIKADFPSGLIYEDNPFYFQTIFAAHRLTAVMERLICYRINRKESIIGDVAQAKSPNALHMLAILACIESRLEGLVPPESWRYFYAYAYGEIYYKFFVIPQHVQTKYLGLAKGLLPALDYIKLRVRIALRQWRDGQFSLRSLFCCSRLPGTKCVEFPRQFPLLTAEKTAHAAGHYDAIIAFGKDQDISTILDSRYPANSFALYPEGSLAALAENFDSLVLGNKDSYVTIEGNDLGTEEGSEPCSDALRPHDIAAICGRIAIAAKVCVLDYSFQKMPQRCLKVLFYKLNCLYYDKDIHMIQLKRAQDTPLPVHSVPHLQSATLVAGEKIDKKMKRILKNVHIKYFSKYITVRLLGLPLVQIRRK